MKSLFTFSFILLITSSALAQENSVQAIESETANKKVLVKEAVKDNEGVARLYRSKHYRVHKELSFATRRDTAKLT